MRIRELERRDLPAIVALYRRAFAETPRVSDERLVAYFEQVLFDHPWYSADLPSLVSVEGEEISGCLGVTPRPLVFDRQLMRSAVSSHFMVDPSRRGSLAGVRLLQQFFEGPQDLSVAEGNSASRHLWERLGGEVSVAYSVHWVSPLRPVAYGLSRGRRSVPPSFSRALAAPLDGLLRRLPGAFRRPAAPLREEPMNVSAFLDEVQRVTARFRVRPHYDQESAAWLFALLERKSKLGRLRRSLLRDTEGAVVGWCIWFEQPGGVSDLVQVGADAPRVLEVHHWLLHAAWRAGSIAIAGRLSPEYLPAQARQTAILSRSDRWMLLHARDPELLAAIHAGRAFLTRLEGEWWIPFDEA